MRDYFAILEILFINIKRAASTRYHLISPHKISYFRSIELKAMALKPSCVKSPNILLIVRSPRFV